jgi:hypothetical protein
MMGSAITVRTESRGAAAVKYEVVRIIRYRYDSADRAIEDQKRWTMSHKDATMEMTSAVLPLTQIIDDAEEYRSEIRDGAR